MGREEPVELALESSAARLGASLNIKKKCVGQPLVFLCELLYEILFNRSVVL